MYSTKFNLSLPTGLDTPLSFVFTNTTTPPLDFRAQLYVNGYKFAKYGLWLLFDFSLIGTDFLSVSVLGPQLRFPVPEGILNYRSENTLALSIWALDSKGGKLDGLALVADAVIETSMSPVQSVGQTGYVVRDGAY